MAPTSLNERFTSEVGRPLSENVNLAPFSNFRIGGEADYFFEAATEEELKTAITFARNQGLRHRVIGGGYNLLFDDNGYRGLILRNTVSKLRLQGQSLIQAASGSTLEELMTFCLDQELGGLEFLVGIPGTLGGAVYGNAGAFDQDIGQVMKEARILTHSGEVVRVDADFFAFSYRYSALKKDGNILLDAVLEGYSRDRAHIRERLDGYRKKREKRHPTSETACAGSYFKNPLLPTGEKVPAAFLLDQVGAKGMTVGDAAVFSGHANFIINQDKANSGQVRELAARLKALVRDRFEVDLEEEVIFLPAEP
jgi:UDP-N-acetylmuramate dehydrogenase